MVQEELEVAQLLQLSMELHEREQVPFAFVVYPERQVVQWETLVEEQVWQNWTWHWKQVPLLVGEEDHWGERQVAQEPSSLQVAQGEVQIMH